MTESAPKRAKMATGQSVSTSAGDTQGVLTPFPMDNADSVNGELSQHNSGKNAKVPKIWYAPSTQDFSEFKGVGAFADHTLLIEKLLNCYADDGTMRYEPVLITAPRRFGKSANLNMVKYFLEIQCDEHGKPIKEPGDLTKPVTDTTNYKLFAGMNIMKHTKLVEEHFGRHPVISLDLKSAVICNADAALMHCRTVLHEAFRRHEYLQGKLDDEANEFFSLWCDMFKCRTIAEDIVQGSLLRLAEYLYTYFKRKVFILVDEYDFIAREIIRFCEEVLEMEKGINIYMTMLSKAIKGEAAENCVQGAMLTGISYIEGMGLSEALNNVTACRFLDDHKFVEFYGMTESEVKHIARLYARTHRIPNIFKKLTKWYNGYETPNGRKIYSITSVGSALANKGKLSSHWRTTGSFYHLVDMLKIPQIFVYVLQLLNGKDLTIELRGKISVDAIVSLNEKIKSRIPDHHLLFSMLLEEGYLTRMQEVQQEIKIKKDQVKVRLPNEEIKSEIRNYATIYFEQTWGFNHQDIEHCALFFEKVKSFDTQNDDFTLALKEFHGNLTEVFEGFSDEQILQMNEDHLYYLMYTISSEAGYRRSTEHCLYNEAKLVGRLDLLLLSPSKDFGIIVELKCNNTREIGNTGDTNKSSLAGLKQILNEKTKYMSALKKHNIEKYLLIGISVDNEKNPSISCLLNSTQVDDAAHLPLPKTESCT